MYEGQLVSMIANVYEIAVKVMFILSIEPIIHKGEKKIFDT